MGDSFPIHFLFISYSIPIHFLFNSYSFPIHFLFISQSFLFNSYSNTLNTWDFWWSFNPIQPYSVPIYMVPASSKKLAQYKLGKVQSTSLFKLWSGFRNINAKKMKSSKPNRHWMGKNESWMNPFSLIQCHSISHS